MRSGGGKCKHRTKVETLISEAFVGEEKEGKERKFVLGLGESFYFNGFGLGMDL